MINYSWEFPSVECVPSENGMTDVVRIVHWRLTASEAKTGDFPSGSVPYWTSDRIGMAELGSPNSSGFIEFSQISKDDIIGWVTDKLTQSGMYFPKTALEVFQEQLSGHIEFQKNPPTVIKSLNFN
jgi:hypothetical protein